MFEKHISLNDKLGLICATSEIKDDRPWIALVIPFGLRIDVTRPFFNFFSSHYNVVTWESRCILDVGDDCPPEDDFMLRNHVTDMKKVLESYGIQECVLVGYCSGAGVSLGAALRYPDLIKGMVLVHGEYVFLDDSECKTLFASEVDSLLALAAKSDQHLSLVFEKINEQKIDDEERPKGLDTPYLRKECLRRYALNYLQYRNNDFHEMAIYVGHKCLLMSGDKDVQTNVKSTKRIAKQMKNAEVFVDPKADHYGILRENSPTIIGIWNYLYKENLCVV